MEEMATLRYLLMVLSVLRIVGIYLWDWTWGSRPPRAIGRENLF